MSKTSILLWFAFFISLAFALPANTANAAIDVEEKIAECQKSCLITYDFQPKCGSDGITYNNQRLLECRDRCGSPYGKGVTKASDGPCGTKH